MTNTRFLTVLVIALLLQQRTAVAAPFDNNDIDSPQGGNGVDYNTVVGHFKDFFMYLPVMMTTLKETMSGFPKFAEGIRILTSQSGRASDDDCKCNKGPGGAGASNEIENSSRYG